MEKPLSLSKLTVHLVNSPWLPTAASEACMLWVSMLKSASQSIHAQLIKLCISREAALLPSV